MAAPARISAPVFNGYFRLEHFFACGCRALYRDAAFYPRYGFAESLDLAFDETRKPKAAAQSGVFSILENEFVFSRPLTNPDHCARCKRFPRSRLPKHGASPFDNPRGLYRRPVVRKLVGYVCYTHTIKEWHLFGFYSHEPVFCYDIPATLSYPQPKDDLTDAEVRRLSSSSRAVAHYSGIHIDAEFMYADFRIKTKCSSCQTGAITNHTLYDGIPAAIKMVHATKVVQPSDTSSEAPSCIR